MSGTGPDEIPLTCSPSCCHQRGVETAGIRRGHWAGGDHLQRVAHIKGVKHPHDGDEPTPTTP